MATTYNAHENTITGWTNVPLEAFQHGEVTIEQIEHQISKQIGAEIGRNGLGEIEHSENHRLHTMDVKLTVAVLSMEKYREMNELVSDLTNDNREMLETIESLQSGLEASEREREQLSKIIRDMEKAEPRPPFPPFSMQADLDEMMKYMGRDNFGFRGGNDHENN